MFCARLCFAVSNNFEVRDENRRASTKNFLHGSEINVQTFVKPRFFTFSLAVFLRHLKSRVSMFVYTFRTNEGVWTREEHRRSLFSRLLRSPNVFEWKKVLGRCHRKLYDAATRRARTPSQVKREQPLTLANIPPEDTSNIEFRMQSCS